MRTKLGENGRMEVELIRPGVWMYFVDDFSVCILYETTDGDYGLDVCQMPPLDFMQTTGVVACLAFAASRMVQREIGVDGTALLNGVEL